MNEVDLKVLTGSHFFFDAALWNKFLKFPATDYFWAQRLRDQPSAIGCGADRKDKSYVAVRCRNSTKAAVFFLERYRKFELNQRFQSSTISPDTVGVELVAAAPPRLVGYTSAKEGPASESRAITLYSARTGECPKRLPSCAAKHIRSLQNEIDDPKLYIS